MDKQKKIVFIVIPLTGALLLGAGLWFRLSGPSEAPGKPAAKKSSRPVYDVERSATAPKSAPPEKIAKATETVRIRGTYQNYRHAVATDDAGLQKIILPMLLKDRDTARQCAEEDLARAQTEFDRTVARRVIDDLRR